MRKLRDDRHSYGARVCLLIRFGRKALEPAELEPEVHDGNPTKDEKAGPPDSEDA